MMQVPNVGAFVRALLPVRLTEGHTVTFGVWLAVHPNDLKPAFGISRHPGLRTPPPRRLARQRHSTLGDAGLPD